jgi:hypothetical protein
MEKYLAGIITASLLVAVLATAGLGELALKDYPKFFPAVPLIVVGDSADHPVATADVVAGIDISVTLAELMTQEKPIPGVVVPTVEGKEFKGLALDGSVPTSTLTKTHISFLKWEGIRYKDVDYTVREKVELPTIPIKGATPGTWDELNGTLYLDLSGLYPEYKLEFVGEVAPNISEVDYENPLKLSVLGREFSIVQVKDNSFVALAGVVGDASKDTPVKFETYEFYAVDGAETWVKIQVKDAAGTVVDTKIINKGAIGSFTLGGKTIYVKPLQAWVSTITNTVTARIVVGTQIDKEYKSGDKYFDSDIFQWDISSSGGEIRYIGVKLLPSAETNTDKIKIGEKLDFAEKYFELGFLGTEVTSYATFTVTPVKVDVYDKNGQNKLLSSKAGLEIASDFPVFESETYKKAYLVPVGTDLTNVTIGFLDPVKGLILAKEQTDGSGDYWYDATADEVQILNVKYDTTVFNIYLTDTGLTFDLAQDVVARYNFTAGEFRLGLTKASAESSDVNVAGTDVGDKDFDITTAYGVIVEKPKTNAASDKLVLKVPSEAQKVTVYVGKKGEVKAEGKTYKEFALVPGAIGKLDTEVLTADKKSLKPEYYNRHLILVGDSAVNRLSALAHNLPFPTYGADPAYKEKYGIKGSGESFIWVMKNPFGVNPDQIVVEVAGWDAADTRLAALALQAGKLKDWDITTGKVILRGTELASVTHEAVTG